MTLTFDENALASYLDGIKRLSESSKSSYNIYPQMYADCLKAYSQIGLYITTVKGKHVITKSDEL